MLDKSATSIESEPQEVHRRNKLQRVFRHRDFRLLWSGAFLSFIGSWIQTVAQGYLVYQLTHDKNLLGLVSFFGMLPVFFLGPIAGSLTDTLNKKALLVICQMVFAVGALYLAAATYWNFVEYWQIVVVALVLGVFSAIEMPARQSIVSQVVPPEDLAIAIPINGLTFNMARLVGPAIGGLLLTAFGPASCYLINGISFSALIFAGLAIRADLRPTEREPQPIWDLVVEGALYTWRDIRLRTLLILESSVSIFGLFYLTQIPAIAEEMLGIGERLGDSYLAVGIGAVLSLILITSMTDKPYKALSLRLAITVVGATLLVLSQAKSVWLAYPAFIVLGFASVTIFNTCNTLFQMLSPDRLRGRVLAMHVWALSGLGPFGIWGFGYLAQKTDLPFTLQLGGILVLVTAVYGWAFRRGLEGVR
ncbi:MAG: MFS transporter [Chlorobia bacterium]|nr:MFS transporter [Fimbriimonadaceae bacterium]